MSDLTTSQINVPESLLTKYQAITVARADRLPWDVSFMSFFHLRMYIHPGYNCYHEITLLLKEDRCTKCGLCQ